MEKYNYSIIIPHYCSDGDISLLRRLIDSIPRRKDIQIIIVDNSKSPISETSFSERTNITIQYSNNSRGAGGARNDGLLNATGKWVLFADSDDYFKENAFIAFDEYLNSESEIIYFNVTSSMSNNTEIESDRHWFYSQLVVNFINKNDESIRYQHFVPWGKLIRLDLIQKHHIAFDEIRYSNDVIFSLYLGLNATLVKADSRTVYCVTMCDGSLTKTITYQSLSTRIGVVLRVNKILRASNLRTYQLSFHRYVGESIKLGVITFFKVLYKYLITGNIFISISKVSRIFKK